MTTDDRFTQACKLLLSIAAIMNEKYEGKFSCMVALMEIDAPSIVFTELSTGRTGAVGMRVSVDADIAEMAHAVQKSIVEFIDKLGAENDSQVHVQDQGDLFDGGDRQDKLSQGPGNGSDHERRN